MNEAFQVHKRKQKETQSIEARAQFLAFSLGSETFAMDIRSIKEVIQYAELTEVPLMPSFMRGVINLRGSVVPVIDLSTRFGREPTQVAKRTCIVILELDHAKDIIVLGIMVDHVSEVLEIAPSEIEPSPAFSTDLRSEFIQGVGKVNQRFVILLDVNHVLSLDELTALASEASSALTTP